jgi:hypothetical protein
VKERELERGREGESERERESFIWHGVWQTENHSRNFDLILAFKFVGEIELQIFL